MEAQRMDTDSDLSEAEGTSAERETALVLVVEDNSETRQLIRLILGKTCRLTFASSADEALARLGERSYDVVLMDINLGADKTGVDVLLMLREMPLQKSTFVIALTAYALPNDRRRLLDAGFDGYTSKPFTCDELRRAIEEAMSTRRAR
jgi:CheY-like chemotaxis protein